MGSRDDGGRVGLSEDEAKRLLEREQALREALEVMRDEGARRRLVADAVRRVLPIYAGWTAATPEPACVLDALEAALPGRVDDKTRVKLGKQLAVASKQAVVVAGYDRKLRRDRDPRARAAAHVCSAIDGALGRYDSFPTVTLGFVRQALEHSGAGAAMIEAELEREIAEAASDVGDRDDGWQASFAQHFAALVPAAGEASTVQGEVLRCLGNLSDEAMRNGNVNFGERHVAMIARLREVLGEATSFTLLERQSVLGALLRVEHDRNASDRVAHRVLARLALRWLRAQSAAGADVGPRGGL